jgi:hypothetical protein
MKDSLLDDKYDALSQRQDETADDGSEVQGKEKENNKSGFPALEAFKTTWNQPLENFFCFGKETMFRDDVSLLDVTKYDCLSWESSYDYTIDTEDEYTLITLLQAQKDRYRMMVGSSISALETDLSTEEKEPLSDRQMRSSSLLQIKNSTQTISPLRRDDDVETTEPFEISPLHRKRTNIMQKMIIEFVLEDEYTDDEEETTTDVLDKYSTYKESSAFEQMLENLGLNHLTDSSNIGSSHTRITTSSALLQSTTHTRSSTTTVSLDAIFTVNSSAILTVHSLTTVEEEGTLVEDKDDDSSTWFGFKESCTPSFDALLAPVSSSRSEDATTSFLSHEMTEADDRTNVMKALQPIDSDFVLRSYSDLAPASADSPSGKTYNVKVADGPCDTPKSSSTHLLSQLFSDFVATKCGVNFFGAEIEFQPSFVSEVQSEEDSEANLDEQSVSARETVAEEGTESTLTSTGHPVIQSVLEFVNISNYNNELQEGSLCCTCDDSRDEADDEISSIVQEEEETVESEMRKRKKRKSRVNVGCKDSSEDTPDEEGDGSIAILVEEESRKMSSKILPSTDDQVEILLKEYKETVGKIDEAFKNWDGCDSSDEEDIETKPLEEVQSLLDHPDFILDVIRECENNRSEEEEMEQCVATTALDDFSATEESSFSIDISPAPSTDSFCIPSPPESDPAKNEVFESPLLSLSCDSFVLSYSSDDVNMPLALHTSNSTGNNPASHRRRHSLDHIPSYHTFFNFQQPVVLPFLQESNNAQQDESFHTAKITKSPTSSSKRETLFVETSFQENTYKKTRPATPASINMATHKRTDESSTDKWKNVFVENTHHFVNTNQDSSLSMTNKVDKETETSGKKQNALVKAAPTKLAAVPNKGILRKDGTNFGTGRRISWNEEQLATKQEKGIMFSSGRYDARSMCPLDKLVMELFENQNRCEEPFNRTT